MKTYHYQQLVEAALSDTTLTPQIPIAHVFMDSNLASQMYIDTITYIIQNNTITHITAMVHDPFTYKHTPYTEGDLFTLPATALTAHLS